MRQEAKIDWLVAVMVIIALALSGVVFAAGGARTHLQEANYVKTMAAREISIPCEGTSYQPSGDATLAICRMDRTAYLKSVDLSVGRTSGTGQTRVYVQLNGTTVAGSTTTVASVGAGAAGYSSTVIEKELQAGDRIHLRIGEVSATSNSAQIWARARLVERF